jgi:hypothetical protein
MRSWYSIITLVFIFIVLGGCSARKNLIGKWKVVDLHLKKNNLIDKNTSIVFDPDGFITFNNGSAARGEWVLNTSQSIITISLYGKASQHDVEIKGEYDFSSDKLTISEVGDESKILLTLEKIEPEPIN